MRFTSATQSLRLRSLNAAGVLEEIGQTELDVAHTGFIQRPDETGQTTLRRLLNINTSGGANTDVVCKLDTTSVRILSVTVWEAPRESINQ